jgi:hypothetical protein
MEFGTALGLAQPMDFDQRVNDLRYRQEAMKRQQDQNAAKAALFAKDMEFQRAANAFDMPKVQEMNRQIVQELGDYVANNPDWETNVQKRSMVGMIKNKLKDNPEVMRAFHSDSNYKQLLGDLQEVAKNPQQHDQDAYNEYLMKWDNYQKYGNQDGPEAASKDGIKPFTYVKPKDFVDLPTTMLKTGAQIKDYDIIPTKYGGYYSKPKPEQLKAMKDSLLQEHGRQIMVEARKMGMTDPKQIDKWIEDGISAGVEKHFKLGDQLGYWEAGMKQKEMNMKHAEAAAKARSQSSNYTPWHYLVDSKNNPAGTISAEDVYKVWGSKHPIKAIGSDGSVADLSDFDFKPNGKYINQGGATFIQGYVDVPLDIAEQRGLYKQGVFTIDGVTAPFKDDVKEVTLNDKDGNEVKAVRVNYNLPVNKNDKVAMQKFNVMVDVDKLVPPTQSPEAENLVDKPRRAGMPKQVVQNGITYTLNERTGQYE